MNGETWLAVGAWLVAGGLAGTGKYRAEARRLERCRRMRPNQPVGAAEGGADPSGGLRLVEALGRLAVAPERRMAWQARVSASGRLESAELWWGVGILSAVGLFVAVAAALVTVGGGLLAVAAGLLTAIFFTAWRGARLGTEAERRRQTLADGLPELFDFLAVSLAAGLTFDAALTHVSPQVEDVAHTELERVRDDMRIGMTRREALHNWADRMRLDDLNRLASLVAQADTLGSGLAEALRGEAARLRAGRLWQARMRAGKLPVRMSIPIVLCLFPGLFIVLLGPAMLDLVKGVLGT